MVDEINKEVDLITAAHMAAQEVKDEREKLAEVLKKVEAYEARTILAGRSNSGQPQKPEVSEDERIRIATKEYFKGSAIESHIR